MGGCSFPEIACTICNRPLDLKVDLSTDENGSAVHEDCFFKRSIPAVVAVLTMTD